MLRIKRLEKGDTKNPPQPFEKYRWYEKLAIWISAGISWVWCRLFYEEDTWE